LLAGSSSYDGVTDVTAGMLVAANSSALGAGGWSGSTMTWIRNGATLALQGGVSLDEHLHLLGTGVDGKGALRSLAGNNALTLTYGGSGSGPGFCFDGDTTVGVDADTLTVTGFYEDLGSFGLTKVGNGTLHINRSNSYTGNTTVNAGTLRLGNGSNSTGLADGADLIVAVGATLHLDYSGTDTIDELWLGGVRKSPGVYSAANGGGFITGTGTITVSNGPVSDYDTWKTANGVNGGPEDDDDEDGSSNFSEYAFGLDPQDGASSSPYLSLPDPATGAFTYTRRKPSISGVDFAIFASGDLDAWNVDLGAVETIIGDDGTIETVEVTLSPALLEQDRLFVRISAEEP
jgi:autotransporter-associated beta strand protein